jgi:broad specificity polyphosphatase/5'/3'-nucleotidase SurE
VAKAITRFDPVKVEKRVVDGYEVHACSGYPADCVQLGIHVLFPLKPDIVVSGVNIGYNHGTAYLQSSGTAAAALEAGIAGVPAIAFSTGSEEVPWKEWKVWSLTPGRSECGPRSGQSLPVRRRRFPCCTAVMSSIGIPDTADATNLAPDRGWDGWADRLFAEQSPGLHPLVWAGPGRRRRRRDTDVGGCRRRHRHHPISGAGGAVRR